MKWVYLEMCGFVQATMALEMVQNNTLLLRIHREKEAQICQWKDLMDREVIEKLLPWWG